MQGCGVRPPGGLTTRGLQSVVQVRYLLLLLMMPLLTASDVPNESRVSTPQEFLSQLLDPTVVAIRVMVDLDLTTSGFAEWDALTEDVVLARNVSIYGSQNDDHAEYTVLDFGWWKKADGQPVTHGVRLAPGVVLVMTRILLKKTSTIMPEFVFSASNTSTVVVYDSIQHHYVAIDPAFAWASFPTAKRPFNAPPGNNSAAQLTSGFCRTAPDPALCWPLAYILADVAQLTPIQPRPNIPSSSVLTLWYGVVVVMEQALNESCLQQFYANKPQCFSQASKDLQAAEAASPTRWLRPTATPAQIAVERQGLRSAPRVPIPPYVPAWLLSNSTTGEEMAAASPPPSSGGSGLSQHAIIGLAVGLGVGVLLLLALAALYMRQRHIAGRHMPAKQASSRSGSSSKEAAQAHDDDGMSQTSQMETLADCRAWFKRLCSRHTSQLDSITDTARQSQAVHQSTQGQGLHAVAGTSQLLEGDGDLVQGDDKDVPTLTIVVDGEEPCECGHASAGGACAAAGENSTCESARSCPSTSTNGRAGALLTPGQPATTSLSDIITHSSPVRAAVNLHVNLDQDVILGEVLGSGGYGTVYRATYGDQQVAVKVFAPRANPRSFEQEVGILARTYHPNVVALLGACFDASRLALVEELCDGSLEQLMYRRRVSKEQALGPDGAPLMVCEDAHSLTQAVPGGPAPAAESSQPAAEAVAWDEEPACSLPRVTLPLPLDLVVSIALQVACGLAYLHPTVIHRDLKPANILLVMPPEPGSHSSSGAPDAQGSAQAQAPYSGSPSLQVKLSDFGLSRMRDAITIVTQRPYCGTVPYMAPECFTRKQTGLTHKCDIYSFGVVLWELLHGEQPWQGYSPAEVLYEVVVNKKRPAIRVADDRCPRQLRKLLVRCWDQDPHRRPAALEIARELAFLQRQLGLQHLLQQL